MNIVLTRPAPRNKELLQLLTAQGLVTIDLPALQLEELDNALGQDFDINTYDAIFFVSRLAAKLFIKNWQQSCKQGNKPLIWPSNTLACAVGFSSANPLIDSGLIPQDLILYPSQEQLNQDSEALWDILSKSNNDYIDKIHKALIVRGQTGREWLSNKLQSQNVHVNKVAIYNRKQVVWTKNEIQKLTDMLENTQQSTVFLLTSSESLASVYNNVVENELLDKWSNCIFVCVHHRIATALQAILSSCQIKTTPKVLITTPANQDIYETILSIAR